MERPNYKLEQNPQYNENVPQLLNDDPVLAESGAFHDLIVQSLNNTKASYQKAEKAQQTADRRASITLSHEEEVPAKGDNTYTFQVTELSDVAGELDGERLENARRIGELEDSLNGLTFYTSLDQLGITYGEETILDITTAMPFNSRLTYRRAGGSGNTGIYPTPGSGGTVEVLKMSTSPIRTVWHYYTYSSSSAKVDWIGYCDGTAWSGWKSAGNWLHSGNTALSTDSQISSFYDVDHIADYIEAMRDTTVARLSINSPESLAKGVIPEQTGLLEIVKYSGARTVCKFYGTENTVAHVGTTLWIGFYANSFSTTHWSGWKKISDQAGGDTAELSGRVDTLESLRPYKEYLGITPSVANGGLGLLSGASLESVVSAMTVPSILRANFSNTADAWDWVPPQYGLLEITKYSTSRVGLQFIGFDRADWTGKKQLYFGIYSDSTKVWSGWEEVATIDEVAPVDHASVEAIYGIGNASNYGHVKVSDSLVWDVKAVSGVASSPYAVKTVSDRVDGLFDALNGWRLYNSLEELGFTNGQEVLEEVCAAMPNRSILYCQKMEATITEEYPRHYGLLKIERFNNIRCKLEFTSYNGIQPVKWIAWYADNVNPPLIKGWRYMGTEAGTWTPELIDSDGNIAELSTADGDWMKTGNTIQLRARIVVKDATALNNNYLYLRVPTALARKTATAQPVGTLRMLYLNVPDKFSGSCVAFMTHTRQVRLDFCTTDTSLGNLKAQNLKSGTDFRMSITYEGV